MHARCARVTLVSRVCLLIKIFTHSKNAWFTFLIKVCVNKGLIHIKSNNRTLKISCHNGKVGVYLRGGTGFESCPMHVINILIYYLFIYLYVSKSDILF